jgi:hypothetical protein
MDAKNPDNSVVDSKHQPPANGELKDSELAAVTGGTTNVVQLSKDAANAGAAAAGAAKIRDELGGGLGPLIGH